MGDDIDEFIAEMADVRPLRQEQKVLLKGDGVDRDAARQRQRAAAQESGEVPGLSTAEIPVLDPFYPLDFKRPGVQNGVYRKLKQGAYPAEARLDLHNYTVEQARVALSQFIADASRLEMRSLIIVHGRGQRPGSRGPVLKSYLNHWLPEIAAVQAFCSAQARHGGLGAIYLMLKKNNNKN